MSQTPMGLPHGVTLFFSRRFGKALSCLTAMGRGLLCLKWRVIPVLSIGPKKPNVMKPSKDRCLPKIRAILVFIFVFTPVLSHAQDRSIVRRQIRLALVIGNIASPKPRIVNMGWAHIHRPKQVGECIESFDGKLEVYALPPYSSELNPVEQV